MTSFGYIKSDLYGNELVVSNLTRVSFPDKYQISSISDVIDQGNDPICVSSVISDMINYNLSICNERIHISPKYIWNINNKPDGLKPNEVFQSLSTGIPNIPDRFKVYAMVKSPIIAKNCLMNYGPLMFCLPVKSMFNSFWNGAQDLGIHAVTVIGWDEKGFLFKNSWGTSYGTNGYYRLPYEDFNNIIEAWTLIL